jgi:zinc protease
MTLRRRQVAALPALAALHGTLPNLAAAQPAPLFGARLWRLPNGLQVAHVPRPGFPAAVQMLWVKAGSVQDPAGRSGVAHFLEHMMFKGTPSLAPRLFSRRVAALGGADNAFTSREVTAYFQEVATEDLPTVMAMEADRFVNALIPAAELESERQVVLEERRQTTEVNPRAVFNERLNATLWAAHPRARPIIGWADEIRATTRDDLHGFFASRYAPGNAVLTVQGGSAAGIEDLVGRIYGAVPARPFTARSEPPPPAAPTEPRLTLRLRGVSDASHARSWIAPSLGTGPREQAAALEVLAHLLGGGAGSRLDRALAQTGLGVGVYAGYFGTSPGPVEFSVGATPRPGTGPAALEQAVDGALAALLDAGPTEAEVARSIRQLTVGARLALDSAQGAARAIGFVLASDLPIEEAEFRAERLRGVTVAAVAAAARTVLGGAPGIVGWLLPEGA